MSLNPDHDHDPNPNPNILLHHGSSNTNTLLLLQHRSSNPNPVTSKVGEEYFGAFRTKSYIDIRSKVRGHLKISRAESGCGGGGGGGGGGEISAQRLAFAHLSDYLLEPKQELVFPLLHKIPFLHGLFLDYFNSSREACKSCVFLLESIHCIHANNHILQRVINRCRKKNRDDDLTLAGEGSALSDLASFIKLENPFSPSSLEQFKRTHDLYSRIMTKIMRWDKIVGFCKKAIGLIGVHDSSRKNKKQQQQQQKKWSWLLDAAARGAYTLCRDLDTMSRMVVRLVVEIEHRRDVIVKLLQVVEEEGRLREVVRELESNEAWFMDQVEELEEHVYLSLLTINRCRMLVIGELLTSLGIGEIVRISP